MWAKSDFIRSFFLFALVASFVAGCAGTASGPAYKQYSAGIAPVPTDKSRIYLIREPAFMASAISARVRINGTTVTELPNGGFLDIERDPGKLLILADNTLPGSIGEWRLSFNVDRGKEYYVLISPNSGAVGAVLLAGVIGAMAEGNGPFRVDVIPKEMATQKLQSLKRVKYGPSSSPSKVTTPPTEEPVTRAKSPPPATKPVTSSAKERLLELKRLLDDGLINQEDYDLKKRQILKDI